MGCVDLRIPEILGAFGAYRLPPNKIGMIIDKGHDFPDEIQTALEHYGPDMWLFRANPDALTTRAVNIYQGDHRG